MATCKTVWFCETDPLRWFENSTDADRFDKINEIERWIYEIEDGYGCVKVSKAVERLFERYEITQRWDWKAPEDVQE